MALDSVLAAAMAKNGITAWGVCDFAALAGQLLPCRAAVRLPAAACAVAVALFPYRFPEVGQPRNLSRYASVNDYHAAALSVMERVAAALRAADPTGQFVPFCDNSPIPEVRAAALAGLGTVGQNGLLLNPTFGSYVFIAELVCDRPLTVTGGKAEKCPSCGRCAAACPAACVGAADKSARCLSAVTQKKGTLTDRETALLRAGGLCWGCDACQDVCPINRTAKIAPHPCFTEYVPLLTREMAEDPALREKAYGWRGAAVLRRNLDILEGGDGG